MAYLLEFIERWLGGLSGAALTFAGFFLCILVIGAFWERRLRLWETVPLFLCGIVLALFSFVDENFRQSITPGRLALFFGIGVLSIAGAFWYFRKKGKAARLTIHSPAKPQSSLFRDEPARDIRGTRLGAPLAILVSVSAVLYTGLSAPQVMIGDEVTHFYMLVHQAEDLSQPNFYAEIPMASGEVEIRRYPHSIIWHYLGAVLYSLTGGAFFAIQLYQSFFLLQLLTVGYLLARDRAGDESRAALLYVLVLASLPLTLLFSVAFYQDVPMTAQIVTAFYLLKKGRWLWASLFLALAIGFKVTAALFYPAFFLLLFFWQIKRRGYLRAVVVTICALAIVLGATWGIGRAIVTYGNSYFYPQAQLEKVFKKTRDFIESTLPVLSEKARLQEIPQELSARPAPPQQEKETKPAIIANHPGDLRIKENYLIYGGIVLWLVLAAGGIGQIYSRSRGSSLVCHQQSAIWLYVVGGSYMVIAYWYIRTSPDARFFLPGLPFILLPIVEKAVCLPKPKIMLSVVATLALLQGGYVLQKAYHLRAITPEIREGIEYLENNPPSGRIFMYPEGNYRFFPTQHEWYLGYQLREFWRADNAKRLEMLHHFGVGAIVVKKHLVAQVDEQITNLGVYPPEFVEDLREDSRFTVAFENDRLLIFFLPSVTGN